MKTGLRPRSIEIQRLANLFIYQCMKEGLKYSVADFDDGLMNIGTQYCFNHDEPDCNNCSLKNL